MKRIGFLLITLVLTIGLNAQERKYELTPTEQKSLEKAAKDMVRTFQENCRQVGDADIPFYEKTCKGGIIEVALEDFLHKDSTYITITSLYGGSPTIKPVYKYLHRLATLAKNTYKEINITSYDCAMATSFTRDPNLSKNGEEWYVGEVKIMQRFRAETKEHWVVEDLVKRVTKVYAKKNEIRRGRGWMTYWSVKLGDITAETIE